MTIVEPLPVSGYGKADWVDYSNYWRELDSEWLMERSILRYQSATLRSSQYPAPKFGQITYNEQSIPLGGGVYADRAEMWSKQHNAWVPLLMLANITSTRDDTGGVAMSHKLAGGKGVQFQPTQTVLDNPILVMGGVLYVDADSVDIKTGAKTVKLTTDAAGLVSDSPISATALSTGGALTAVSAALSGSLTVPNITMSGTLSGGTFRGIVDGTTVNASVGGTLGGVGLSGNLVTASAGLIAQGLYAYGDANTAWFAQRAAGGAVSSSKMLIDATYVRFRAPNGIPLDKADGTFTGAWIGGAIVSASDPGAANFPNGTIWCS